jgi:hypothetical protein
MAEFVTKDPDGVLDYTFDWETWLGSDTISTSSWVVPTGLTENSDSNTTTTATVWLSGGTAWTWYTVVNRVITAGGRTEDRTLIVLVVER